MRIVLDTNVLFDAAVLRALPATRRRVVLPAVAFAERCRQVLRRGGTMEELWHVLDVGDIVVESYGVDEALRRPLHKVPDAAWRRLGRDALIAGHVGAEDELWTSDVDDFVAVGVPREQIRDTAPR